MSTTLFSITYFGPVSYFFHLRRSAKPLIEACEHYTKQTFRNRCLIATANGPMPLSLPVEQNNTKIHIRDVRLSDHGHWRHLHWNSIESAYNSSPFFEYYAEDIKPFFERKTAFLFDFNEAIRLKICELLDIPGQLSYTSTYLKSETLPQGTIDLRDALHPKKDPGITTPPFIATPYYQVFDRKFGFQPNLSILDLLFNMGPESILYL